MALTSLLQERRLGRLRAQNVDTQVFDFWNLGFFPYQHTSYKRHEDRRVWLIKEAVVQPTNQTLYMPPGPSTDPNDHTEADCVMCFYQLKNRGADRAWSSAHVQWTRHGTNDPSPTQTWGPLGTGEQDPGWVSREGDGWFGLDWPGTLETKAIWYDSYHGGEVEHQQRLGPWYVNVVTGDPPPATQPPPSETPPESGGETPGAGQAPPRRFPGFLSVGWLVNLRNRLPLAVRRFQNREVKSLDEDRR